MAFGKHIKVLLDHNISLQLRLKYFDTCVGPALLFGTAVLPMTRTQLQDLDRLQRKMLRRIVGWRRIEGEDCRDTMVRMNQRLSRAIFLSTLADLVCSQSMEVYISPYRCLSITLGSYNAQIQFQSSIRSGGIRNSVQNAWSSTTEMGGPHTWIWLEDLVTISWKTLT